MLCYCALCICTLLIAGQQVPRNGVDVQQSCDKVLEFGPLLVQAFWVVDILYTISYIYHMFLPQIYIFKLS